LPAGAGPISGFGPVARAIAGTGKATPDPPEAPRERSQISRLESSEEKDIDESRSALITLTTVKCVFRRYVTKLRYSG
jgi:hypothetical protein